MSDRRRVPRTTIWKAAEIEMQALLVFECLVIDISTGGAQLQLSCDMPPTDEFNFSFDGFRTTRQCRVAWRNNRNVGVEFLASAA